MLDRSSVSSILDLTLKANVERLTEYDKELHTNIGCYDNNDKELHTNIGCYDNNPESTGEVADPDVQDAQEPGQHWDIEENDLLSDGMIGAELYMSRGGKLMQALHVNYCIL
jgi:hypothetical protein